MDDSAEEYEVEKIIGHNFVKKAKGYDISYLIKWLGYSDEDNTWEKESNVYAIDMVIEYWLSKPKHSADRKRFVRIQKNKSEPILLPDEDEPKVQAETATNTLSDIVPEQQEPQQLSEITENTTLDTVSNNDDAITPPTIITKRLPVVVANDSPEDEDDKGDLYDGDGNKEEQDTDSDFNPASENMSVHSSEGNKKAKIKHVLLLSDTDSSDVEELNNAELKINKRKRRTYSDYFLEEHQRKQRSEDNDLQSSDAETNSVASLEVKNNKSDDNDSTVLFDEYYGIDPPLDWNELAEKVEHIGNELPEAPIYCLMRWKNGVRSMHPLSLVKAKRPDLLVDCFESMIKTKKNKQNI